MVTPEDIKGWIEENLEGARVEITGDGHHFEAEIICDGFEGKNRIQQHQMVYGALQQELASEAIHALALNTSTPSDAASA